MVGSTRAEDPGTSRGAGGGPRKPRPLAIQRWVRSKATLAAWRRLLDAGVPAVLEVLESTDPRRDWLRRSEPLAGMVSQEERLDFLRSWWPPR